MLPIDKHGFTLHKTAFRDSLSLRYGWPLQNSPSHWSCGPCPDLQNRRLPSSETQWSVGHQDKWQPNPANSMSGESIPHCSAIWCKTGCHNLWFLGWKIWKAILYLTLAPNQIMAPFQQCSTNMRKKREGDMTQECKMLSIQHSLHWCYQQMGVQ